MPDLTHSESDRRQAPSIRRIAIASGKGGTGKSILTSSIGALLARCGFRVLLVDTDVFTAGLSFYLLGQNPRRVNYGLQDIFLKAVSPELLHPIAVASDYTAGRLHLLPAISR